MNIVPEEIKKERFTFGKYKGKMIANVMITDKDYMLWLSEDQYRFELSQYWQEQLSKLRLENKNLAYTTYVR